MTDRGQQAFSAVLFPCSFVSPDRVQSEHMVRIRTKTAEVWIIPWYTFLRTQNKERRECMERTKNYDLIALDMDGTLLRSDKTIGKRTLRAIGEAAAAGRAVCLATGRPLCEIAPYEKQLGPVRYCMLESGALLYDRQEKKILKRRTIPSECIAPILDATQKEDMMVQAMAEGRSLVSGDEIPRMAHWHMEVYEPLYRQAATPVPDIREWIKRNAGGIEKINLYHISRERSRMTRDRLEGLPIERIFAEQSSLELSPKGVDKGSGLLDLCEVLGIPRERAIAVGDADNDLPMLRAAGLGAAMGNANAHVLAQAEIVTGTNDEDGCASVIDTYLLGKE